MKPVMQTDTSPATGNCFSACLATVLELPIEQVPNFFEVAGPQPEKWWAAVRDWLRPRGWGVLTVGVANGLAEELPGILIISGKTARHTDHSTVWKDGVMVHDPYPGGEGLTDVQCVDLLYPLDASALIHWRPKPLTWADVQDLREAA